MNRESIRTFALFFAFAFIFPGCGNEDLKLGGTFNGDLRTGDEKLASGEFIDYVTFYGEAGQIVKIACECESGEDPDFYLMVFKPSSWEANVSVISADFEIDDVDATRDGVQDSRSPAMTIRLSETGVYRIGVTTKAAGNSGRYKVSLSEGTESELTPMF
ncbi:MAG: hypothetical protein NUW37_05035 [Planctomycetes bacterium]|nr:hypothetical protein [Planctomycetota bacterium]